MAKYTFKILVVSTAQDFKSMFGHFLTLYMKGLKLVIYELSEGVIKFLHSCHCS